MISPLKVIINGLNGDIQPLKVVIKGINDVVSPIKIVIADIDVAFGYLNKVILFKHFSKCKDYITQFFGKLSNVIKSTFYIQDKKIFLKSFGKFNTTVFYNKIYVNGWLILYAKLNNKIKSKTNVKNAFVIYFEKFHNKIKNNFKINKNDIFLIFNYRFRKWSSDGVTFSDTIIEKDQQLTFGETCYREIYEDDV